MRKITGKIEFFSELGITAAVVRSYDSKGGFNGVLSIKEGDRLILSKNQEVILDTLIKENKALQIKKHSGIIIPEGLDYEVWLQYLRDNLDAELHTNRSPY